MLEARIPLDIEDVARILELAGDSVQQFITYRCQPFIELDDGKLKFMHSSVRDYCLQSRQTRAKSQEFERGPRDATLGCLIRQHMGFGHPYIASGGLPGLRDALGGSKSG
ncbi:hypothetical protein HYQ46_005243 [Verticillium longisporum]|nr:hypothetical protein HYQ46_005243 [Verticillium longisporum]